MVVQADKVQRVLCFWASGMGRWRWVGEDEDARVHGGIAGAVYMGSAVCCCCLPASELRAKGYDDIPRQGSGEVPCLGCREEFPVTGLSRPEAAGEAARGGTCIQDRTVLVPAPSTVSWLVVHTYRQVEMRGLRRSDEIPHDFQSQPSSGRVRTVCMTMYNPAPQRSPPPARLYALHV